MAELVLPEGYPLEEYTVETADGYLLALYRIPHGRFELAQPATACRPIVYLQHALLDCSASWVNNGADASLAFILADAGFDVWMGNSRGSTYSRRHINLSADSAEFWAFSWDEMAAFDLPAFIDFALAATHEAKLGYIGHSQGTTIGFAALSSQAELQEKVSLAVMLAPVTFLGHISSKPVQALARMQTDQVFKLLGVKEFLPSQQAQIDIFGQICEITPSACLSAIGLICGYNPDNIDMSRMPLYLSYTPAGTSVQNMEHWAQGVRRPYPAFARYDYGDACVGPMGLPQKCNRNMYGTDDVPLYRLKDIKVPLALFSGGQDMLSDAQDISVLVDALAPEHVVYAHVIDIYEHLDFTWGINAHVLVYPAIKQLLFQHAGNWTSVAR
ncbi:hypothetical protein WJX72_000027 [[Myrmecia] bisecta]|uniref:Lipase n=1 Tax=[Myrmecia] bisecta TaxID=41462 RepID=A0AAW1R3Z6_9CHLO